MAINDALLIELYDRQKKTPEKLAGTKDLMIIGDDYRGRSRSGLYSNEDLLARLLDLRKGGKLPRKTDRTLGKSKPEVWPPIKEMQRLDGKGYYRIAIEVDVTIEHIVEVIYTAMKLGEPEPLSRAEVYRHVQKWLPRHFDPTAPNRHEAFSIARRLFPELLED